MDPIIIIEEGPHVQHTWTHLINLEMLAEYHGRTPGQLMGYLKATLNSMGTYENKLYGTYNVAIIRTVLQAMTWFDLFHKICH